MDTDLRELARKLREGDISIAERLLINQYRAGQVTRPAIEFLAFLDYEPALKIYLSLGMRRKPKLTRTLWAELGQYIGIKLAGAWLNYPFLEIFNNYPQWEAISQLSPELLKEYKDLILNILMDVQNLKPLETLNPQKFKKLNSWLEAFLQVGAQYLPDPNADRFSEPPNDAISTFFVQDDQEFTVIPGPVGQRCFAHLYIATKLLRQLQIAATPSKQNTFFKLIEKILDYLSLFQIEKESKFAIFKNKTQALENYDILEQSKLERKQDRLRKEALKNVYAWILPKALEIILISPTVVKTSADDTRSLEFYQEALKAKRYSHVTAHLPVDINRNEIRSIPDSQLFGDQYPRFIVWVTGKAEARERAEKVAYKLWGYIPDISIYPRVYGTWAEVEKGLHEDAILQNENIVIPEDVFRYPGGQPYLITPEMRQTADEELQRIIESRPDLYHP